MFLAFYLYSQDSFLDIQNYKLSNSLQNLLLEDSLNPQSQLSKSLFIFGMGFNRAVNNVLVVKDSADNIDKKYSVDVLQGLDLHLGFLIRKRILIGLSGDYKQIALGDSTTTKWEFGDPKLSVKVRLTPQDKKYAVALSLYGTYPVTKNSYYASDVGWTAGGIVSFDYFFSRGFIALNIGGAYSPETSMPVLDQSSNIGSFSIKGKILGGIGAGFFINDYLSIQNEYYGSVFLPKNGDILYKSLDALLYLKVSFNSFNIYAGGSLRGLSFFQKDSAGARGSLESRIFVALRYNFIKKENEKEAPKEESLDNLTMDPPSSPDLLSSGLEMETFSENISLPEIKTEEIAPVSISNSSTPLAVVYFDFAKTNLTVESKKILDGIVQDVKNKYTQKIIKIYGHTDGRGPRKLHKKYSLERANNVKEYLQRKGVLNTIEVFSYEIPQRVSKENILEEASFRDNRRVGIFVQ